jgi:hypothetical protein
MVIDWKKNRHNNVKKIRLFACIIVPYSKKAGQPVPIPLFAGHKVTRRGEVRTAGSAI